MKTYNLGLAICSGDLRLSMIMGSATTEDELLHKFLKIQTVNQCSTFILTSSFHLNPSSCLPYVTVKLGGRTVSECPHSD